MGKIIPKKIAFSNQFLRFVLSGAFNTLLTYGVYAVALAIGFPYPLANLIALLLGIIASFTSHSKFVFNRPEYGLFGRFLFCWALIYCANVALIHQMIDLQFDAYQAGLLALPANVVLSFIIQKYFVFAREDSKN